MIDGAGLNQRAALQCHQLSVDEEDNALSTERFYRLLDSIKQKQEKLIKRNGQVRNDPVIKTFKHKKCAFSLKGY